MPNGNTFFFFVLFAVMGWVHSPAQEPQKKTSVAVLNFANAGGVDGNEISILTDRFSNYLVNAGSYRVMEREKMDAILKEQDFSLGDDCNSSECAVQIGQLLGVERMVAGKVGKFGEVYTLDVRVIDVSSGEILRTKSENYEGRKEGLLDMIQKLAFALSERTLATVKTPSTPLAKALPEAKVDRFVDSRDGREYATVVIGNQIWMAENLSFVESRGSSCYENNPPNCTTYGRLYNWGAAQRAVPDGWRLPTREDWQLLHKTLSAMEGGAYGQIMPGGKSGFNCRLGGYRSGGQIFSGLETNTYFWSSTPEGNTSAWTLGVGKNSKSVFLGYGDLESSYAVRCIKIKN